MSKAAGAPELHGDRAAREVRAAARAVSAAGAARGSPCCRGVVVIGGLVALIVTSPGWDAVQRDVLLLGGRSALVPGRARRLLARREAVRAASR